MAPPEVVNRVRLDYLSALAWLQEAVLTDWSHQWAVAPMYLAGAYLRRYRALIGRYSAAGSPRCVGVLRADHDITVRHFSAEGTRCLIIDNQQQRRMATYDRPARARVSTQDLENAVMVYQMVYDEAAGRWKIDSFVQELPQDYLKTGLQTNVDLLLAVPLFIGRDS